MPAKNMMSATCLEHWSPTFDHGIDLAEVPQLLSEFARRALLIMIFPAEAQPLPSVEHHGASSQALSEPAYQIFDQ